MKEKWADIEAARYFNDSPVTVATFSLVERCRPGLLGETLFASILMEIA